MILKFQKPKKIEFLLGTIAALVAFSITMIRGLEETFIQDAQDYVLIASKFMNGWDFVISNNEQFQRTIGFPFLIFLTFMISSSESLLFIKMILAVSHGISTFFLGRISEMLGLGKSMSVSVMFLFALDPFLLISATDVQTETLTTLLVIYWTYLYLALRFSYSKNSTILLSFAFSGFLGLLIRPNILIPFLFLSLLFVLKALNIGIRRRVIVYSFALFLTLFSLYEIVLYKIYGGFVFLSAQGGIGALFICKKELIPQYLGYASPEKNAEINLWVLNHLATVIESLKLSDPTLSVGEVSDKLLQIGIDECKDNPVTSAVILLIKVVSLWRPFTVYGAYSTNIFIISALMWIPLTITAVWFLLKKNSSPKVNEIKVFFILLATGFTVSLLITPTQIRHRVAFAEPFYWLFLALFISTIFNKGIQSRNSRLRFNRKPF